MRPSRPENDPLTVPEDEPRTVESTDCIPDTTAEDPIIVISSGEEDNNDNHEVEVIELSDTEPEVAQDMPRLSTHRTSFASFMGFGQDEEGNQRFGIFRQPQVGPNDYPPWRPQGGPNDYPPRIVDDTPLRLHPMGHYNFYRFLEESSGHGRDRFEADLQAAIRASMEEPLAKFGPKKISHPEPPASTTVGYSRSARSSQVACCALCRSELGDTIPPENKDDGKSSSKKRKRFSRFSDLTDVERALSKRMFFTKCGHVYCGLCVQFIKRKRTTKQKKEEKVRLDSKCITDFKGRYVDTPFSLIDKCVVPGCNEKLPRTRGKFFKEMFT